MLNIWLTASALAFGSEEQTLPLGEVMRLSVGQTLPLAARPEAPVTLRCGNVPLFRARIGRVGDHVAVRVVDKVDRRGEQS